jgi:serine/threonine protein kinase
MRLTAKVKTQEHLPEGHKIGEFVVTKFLASGGFSQVYVVKSPNYPKSLAIKIERKEKESLLKKESTILLSIPKSIFFPKVYETGSSKHFFFSIMDLFGPPLSRFVEKINRSKNIYSLMFLASEMLEAIHTFHESGYIHNDICNQNFVFRPDKIHPVCLIDFGLSFPYLVDGNHISKSSSKEFLGTPRYTSINALNGITVSRRDDLISWLYCVVDLISGKLPWSGKTDLKILRKLREKTSTKKLCSGCPSVLVEISEVIFGLGFEEKPPYELIKAKIDSTMNGMKSQKMAWETFPAEKWREISMIPMDF